MQSLKAGLLHVNGNESALALSHSTVVGYDREDVRFDMRVVEGSRVAEHTLRSQNSSNLSFFVYTWLSIEKGSSLSPLVISYSQISPKGCPQSLSVAFRTAILMSFLPETSSYVIPH